jgi:hypothetical protein
MIPNVDILIVLMYPMIFFLNYLDFHRLYQYRFVVEDDCFVFDIPMNFLVLSINKDPWEKVIFMMSSFLPFFNNQTLRKKILRNKFCKKKNNIRHVNFVVVFEHRNLYDEMIDDWVYVKYNFDFFFDDNKLVLIHDEIFD